MSWRVCGWMVLGAWLLGGCDLRVADGVEDPFDDPEAEIGSTEAASFTKRLPGPSCEPQDPENFRPRGGYSGGIPGNDVCGPRSPSCPTSYVPGNTGAPCTSSSQCTGLDPVCLTGKKFPHGSCAATGCELGSNYGCPAGDTCIQGSDRQTYCVQGCGYSEEGCFVHCARDGYSCFATESRSLGACFGADGSRQCDPTEEVECDPTTTGFGPGICVQTGWDDRTIGRCFETCHPIRQDCSRDGEGCYSLREYSPYPVCFQNWGFPQGASCKRMTQCGEGLRCSCDYSDPTKCARLTNMHCQRYCAVSQTWGYRCPSGTYCRPLRSGSSWGSCQQVGL